MNVEKNVKNACEVALKVTASAEEIATAAKEALNMAVRNASLPGFRKGKVPRNVVEKKFAEEIKTDTQNRALRMLHPEVLKAAELDDAAVIGVRNVEDAKLDESGFSYTITLELNPKISAPRYRGIEVEKKPETVSDEDVAERLEMFRKAFAKYEDATENDSIGEGDFVNISYKATVDGQGVLDVCPEAKAVADNDDFWLQIEDGRFIPEVIEALKGMKAGESKTAVHVNFGENAPDALKNKDASYDITVKSFRARRMPDDETFLKDANEESIDAMKAHMRERMETEAKNAAKADRRRQVIETLLKEAGEFEVPPSMVQRRVHDRLDEMATNAQRSGVTAEYLQEHRDEILATAQSQAVQQVRLAYVLEAIADAENIEITDEQIKETITKMVADAPGEKRSVDEIIATLRHEGRYEPFRSQLRAEKALDVAVDGSK